MIRSRNDVVARKAADGLVEIGPQCFDKLVDGPLTFGGELALGAASFVMAHYPNEAADLLMARLGEPSVPEYPQVGLAAAYDCVESRLLGILHNSELDYMYWVEVLHATTGTRGQRLDEQAKVAHLRTRLCAVETVRTVASVGLPISTAMYAELRHLVRKGEGRNIGGTRFIDEAGDDRLGDIAHEALTVLAQRSPAVNAKLDAATRPVSGFSAWAKGLK
jgi:hypothetical protein